MNTTHRAARRTRLALVAGAAVLASVTTPLATASAVTPAAKTSAQNPAPVTVVQEGSGGVVTGDVPASKLRFTATLPAGFTGDVRARLVMDYAPEEGTETAPWVAAGLKGSTCSLNGGPGAPCTFVSSGVSGPFVISLDLPTATAVPGTAGRTLTWEVQLNAATHLIGAAVGTIDLTDASGTALASAPMKITFLPGVASTRPTFFGRDAAGVLWQYESDGLEGSAAYKPRTRVGGGWNIYDAITRLGRTATGSDVKGVGDDLVARDAAGQLWLYQGTGKAEAPFKSRKLVGGGWGQYTSIVGMGDSRQRGVNDLVARDRDGVLWFYRGTGNPDRPFKARVKVAAGLNQYTQLAAFPTGQIPGGLLAKDAAGALWFYKPNQYGDGPDPLEPRERLGTGFGSFTALVFAGDKDRRGATELLARDRDGNLWMYPGAYRSGHVVLRGNRVLVGSGWNIYNALI
ncbi:hypothetical protein OG389_06640 [Streptomyces sp. NBC_00435]|uniref:hypothetical protein n=1 Tax=Streptomyces sp. NBC_00435 TaxID=2903649 RepID=UPI002E1DD5FB